MSTFSVSKEGLTFNEVTEPQVRLRLSPLASTIYENQTQLEQSPKLINCLDIDWNGVNLGTINGKSYNNIHDTWLILKAIIDAAKSGTPGGSLNIEDEDLQNLLNLLSGDDTFALRSEISKAKGVASEGNGLDAPLLPINQSNYSDDIDAENIGVCYLYKTRSGNNTITRPVWYIGEGQWVYSDGNLVTQ